MPRLKLHPEVGFGKFMASNEGLRRGRMIAVSGVQNHVEAAQRPE